MNTQEIWKVIAECNGQYYVSSWGRVKSYKNGKERILKPGLSGSKYLVVVLSKPYKKTITVHRLVALTFIKNTDNKPQVNHKDGNKLNNHIDNLEWNTSKENLNHAWKTGLFESKRLAVSKAKSKPVIDIISGKKYDSLKLACKVIGDSYNKHALRVFQKSKLQRFFYL